MSVSCVQTYSSCRHKILNAAIEFFCRLIVPQPFVQTHLAYQFTTTKIFKLQVREIMFKLNLPCSPAVFPPYIFTCLVRFIINFIFHFHWYYYWSIRTWRLKVPIMLVFSIQTYWLFSKKKYFLIFFSIWKCFLNYLYFPLFYKTIT